jgi:hypothetical protein
MEAGGAGGALVSWPMMFKGTVWHPAKAKVVSKAAASDREWVIVLLHEQTPEPTKWCEGVV